MEINNREIEEGETDRGKERTRGLERKEGRERIHDRGKEQCQGEIKE